MNIEININSLPMQRKSITKKKQSKHKRSLWCNLFNYKDNKTYKIKSFNLSSRDCKICSSKPLLTIMDETCGHS